MSPRVGCPGAEGRPSSAAKVRKPPNFGARSLVTTPRSPIASATVGPANEEVIGWWTASERGEMTSEGREAPAPAHDANEARSAGQVNGYERRTGRKEEFREAKGNFFIRASHLEYRHGRPKSLVLKPPHGLRDQWRGSRDCNEVKRGIAAAPSPSTVFHRLSVPSLGFPSSASYPPFECTRTVL